MDLCSSTGELPAVLVRGVAGDLTPGAGRGSIGLHLQEFRKMKYLLPVIKNIYSPHNGALTLT